MFRYAISLIYYCYTRLRKDEFFDLNETYIAIYIHLLYVISTRG